MDSQLEQIRDQQRTIWNKFSPGWKKWDLFNMRFLQPMGDAIIGYLQIKDTDNVLDVATGTGEPGLTMATLAKNGRVTGTDLSDDMLKIAAFNAAAKGIHNYETRVADICELPFADNSFDAISCRMGFMFFPDMKMAVSEMWRVLKPGGRMATSVWGEADKNFWIASILGVVSKHIEMNPPIPGGPGMFRCGKPGLIATLLAEGGFIHVTETALAGKVEYSSADLYWENMMEVAAPVVSAMARTDEATRAKIKHELFALLHTKNQTGTLNQTGPLNQSGPLTLDYATLIIGGEKPA